MLYSILMEIVSVTLALVIAWETVKILVTIKWKPARGETYEWYFCKLDDDGYWYEVSKEHHTRFATAFMVLNILQTRQYAVYDGAEDTGEGWYLGRLSTKYGIVFERKGDLDKAMVKLYEFGETINDKAS